MKLNSEIIKKGFVIAGIMNITGPLIFSRFLTNEIIPQIDPDVMSNFGLVQIVVWGLIYIAMSKKYEQLKWLIGVFVIEKLIYSVNWTSWMMNNSLTSVYEKDTMAGVFYTIYGINDLFFFLFFLVVFFKLLKPTKN
ncbi:MAG: hypothetical protein P8Q53_03665 [Flavobacteriaceae bacterium]|nr:hypothetical protein [Flavobacteriaceae bacterium]MDG1508859.1 hypothetical protein [Flavobacteriaceae bacterium]|tara:strand:+ start:417 stop:827 length:411 start_codon:yes stop_codon:yes gene_type:complete